MHVAANGYVWHDFGDAESCFEVGRKRWAL